jgi:hypothetical protein
LKQPRQYAGAVSLSGARGRGKSLSWLETATLHNVAAAYAARMLDTANKTASIRLLIAAVKLPLSFSHPTTFVLWLTALFPSFRPSATRLTA